MFDTHCHLNFSRFKKNIEEVIKESKEKGVEQIVIPGTDIESSTKAIEIAGNHEGLYAAVGIHPHHVYEMFFSEVNMGPVGNFPPVSAPHQSNMRAVGTPSISATHKNIVDDHLKQIETLVQQPKVVAVGEVGLDRHVYEQTKYEHYHIDERFIELQKQLFTSQVELAIQYKKSLVIHNREAKKDLFEILQKVWSSSLERKAVFHCCEPDFVQTSSGKADSLLDFAKEHRLFIGVDGDITYNKEKQEFIKKIPLDMLVLETDSPFLLPEPLRSQKLFPNKPSNIPMIAEFIAKILEIPVEKLAEQTTTNAKELFQL